MAILKRQQIIIFVLILVIISLTISTVFLRKPVQNKPQNCSRDYPFTSPDIDCSSLNEKSAQIEALHNIVEKIVDEEINKKDVKRVSVFYRDLNTRRWFGIDDTDTFYIASLIKLPISLIYYKIAELEPDILSRKLDISPQKSDVNEGTYYLDKTKALIPGKSYTIQEMIDAMLIYSDNTPFATLADAAKLFRTKVLTDLGVYIPPSDQGPEAWTVSPRSYANIYRMLYNASYLNLHYANEVLQTLSKSNFTKGIVAGVPSGITVAHKFGEATAVDSRNNQAESRFLNDCGIVYKPNSPYIICIMTEGSNFSLQEKTIQRISKASYEANQH